MTLPSSLGPVTSALLQACRGGPAADDARLSPLVTSVQEAYRVQEALVRALDTVPASSPTAKCWKSGGPSRKQPLTHAPLPCVGVRRTGSNMAGLHLRSPAVEAEVALRLRIDVGPLEAATFSHRDASAVVDAMCVSIGVVDSRWINGRHAPPLLKLADMQSHGALVLGEWKPFEERDWSSQRCRVRVGMSDWMEFEGTHSLRDPAWLLPIWLRHATRDGATLPAGTVVTTGTWCGLLDAAMGERVEAEFPGIGASACQL